MKKILLSPFLLISFFACAQQPEQTTSDSVTYYKRQLDRLWRSVYDSVQQSQQYTTLTQNIERLRERADHYSGAIMTFDICYSNYKNINQSLSQNGFSPLNPASFRFGFGVSNKTQRTLFDIYFFIAGFNNTSKKGNAAIKTSLSNVFQFDLGYDILQTKRFSIYPFAGLSFRLSSLAYDTAVQVNSGYTNISNIITNDRSVQASSVTLGYQAGVGFDFLLSKPAQKSAVFLFTKLGVNRPVRSDRYKIENVTYNPGIQQGDYLVSLGLKITSRN